jgi:Na+/H+ antiporter NhaA
LEELAFPLPLHYYESFLASSARVHLMCSWKKEVLMVALYLVLGLKEIKREFVALEFNLCIGHDAPMMGK